MNPRKIGIYWLWAAAGAIAAVVLLTPAPAPAPETDASKLAANRADETWRVTRLETQSRSAARTTENIAELTRSNIWGGQFQTDNAADEKAKRWRLAGVSGQGRDRVVLIQFGDDRILGLKVGDKFPDDTPIVDIKDNGVCVTFEGKKRLLPLAEQTIPIVW